MAELLKVSEPSSNLFSVYRPNTGRQAKPEKLSILQKKYTKVGSGGRGREGGRWGRKRGGEGKEVREAKRLMDGFTSVTGGAGRGREVVVSPVRVL